MDVAFWQLSNNPPNYDSVADAMTFLIMMHSTCTGSFYGSLLVLLCWSLVLMYYASKYMRRIITLLLYYITASGCDAL